jgi:hypothetical protein
MRLFVRSRFDIAITSGRPVVVAAAMSLAVAAPVSLWAVSVCRGRFRSRRPAASEGVAGVRMREKRFCHARWMSSFRRASASTTSAGAVRDEHVSSLDEDDPVLSPARTAAEPWRPSRNPRPAVEPGASWYGRPSRAEVERAKRGDKDGDRETSAGRRERSSDRRKRKRGLINKGQGKNLAEGAEVFALVTAVGVTTLRAAERADLTSRQQAARAALTAAATAEVSGSGHDYYPSVAVASALSNPALFAVPNSGWIGDLALLAAVVLGAALRRTDSGADENRDSSYENESSRRSSGSPSETVLARVRRLESAHDRVSLTNSRNARDLSKVATRVRLVRRELSPALRKVQALTEARDSEAAVLEARVGKLGDDLLSSQRTIGALQSVTAKQFAALAGAVSELKRQREVRGGGRDVRKTDGEAVRKSEKDVETGDKEFPKPSGVATTESRDGLIRETPQEVVAEPEVVHEPRDEDVFSTTSEESRATQSEESALSETTSSSSAGANVTRVLRRRSLTFRVGGGGGSGSPAGSGPVVHGTTTPRLSDESGGGDVAETKAPESKE